MTRQPPRAWIVDWADRPAEDRRLSDLLCGRLKSVRYAEIAYEGEDGPAWIGGRFDSIDYGIELDFDDGRAVAMIWLQAGDNEGVLVYAGALQPDQLSADADVQFWDVTSRWQDHGGQEIAGVSTFWSRVQYGPGTDRHGNVVEPPRLSDYHMDGLVLTWETGREFAILLGERDRATGEFRYSHENLCVFFARADAARHGVKLQDFVNP